MAYQDELFQLGYELIKNEKLPTKPIKQFTLFVETDTDICSKEIVTRFVKKVYNSDLVKIEETTKKRA